MSQDLSQDRDNIQTDIINRSYKLARDREKRQIRPPKRYAEADMVFYALSIAEQVEHAEPTSYKEAMKNKDIDKWEMAMKEELDSLLKNNTWELVNKPQGQRILGCKWIYKLKKDTTAENKVKFKARLVAKGYSQIDGVDFMDFNEIYSVVKHCSIRLILAFVTQFDLGIRIAGC